MASPSSRLSEFFGAELAVINAGLAGFAESLLAQGVRVTHLDWRPPAEGVVRFPPLREEGPANTGSVIP